MDNASSEKDDQGLITTDRPLIAPKAGRTPCLRRVLVVRKTWLRNLLCLPPDA